MSPAAASARLQREAVLDEERLDVIDGGRRQSGLDLATTMEQAGDERRTRRGDWTSVTDQRGFTAMCLDFLNAVEADRKTDLGAILRTNELAAASWSALVGSKPNASVGRSPAAIARLAWRDAPV